MAYVAVDADEVFCADLLDIIIVVLIVVPASRRRS